jgi:hypothetical protein
MLSAHPPLKHNIAWQDIEDFIGHRVAFLEQLAVDYAVGQP